LSGLEAAGVLGWGSWVDRLTAGLETPGQALGLVGFQALKPF